MATRITGLTSGLDTEALVSAMVMNYRAKVTKNEKAQTSLSYKMDALKSVNTDVYNLFGAVDKLRWSSAYSLKNTSVSDPTKAKVTAGDTAVNGTQTLEIKELAQAGYLTGGNVKSKAGALSTSTKLSDITSTSGGKTNEFQGGSITITVGGKDTTINFYEGMTAQNLVNTLKDNGLNASFDPDNARFFISSKESGADKDFSLMANDEKGMQSLMALGLYVSDKATTDEYTKWSNYTTADVDKMVADRMASATLTDEDNAKSYAAKYNSAVDAKKSAEEALLKLKNDNMLGDTATLKDFTDHLDSLNSQLDFYKTKGATYEQKKDSDGNLMTDSEGKPVMEWNTDGLSEEDLTKFKELQAKVTAQESAVKSFKDLTQTISDRAADITKYADYVGTIDSEGRATAATSSDANWSNITADTAKINSDTEAKIRSEINNRITESQKMVQNMSNYSTSDGAVRKVGKDAKILLNDAEFTSSSNNFSINGLSIEATALTSGAISITTGTDNQGIYDKIKDFLQQYNDVINKINKLYNAPSAKGYNPLSEDEKAAMSEKEVSKWESKIKDSILRRDGTLGDIMNAMSGAMSGVFDIGGKNYSLSNFGIKTLGYFSSKNNENYAFHIDGDSDDGAVSGNPDKLMAAIVKDPETVVSFFQKLSSSLYDSLNAKMKSSTLSSAYVIYNDKEMASEYSDYTSTIAKWQDKVATQEEAYYKKFAAMEKTLASLQSQTNSLSGYFG